MKKNLLFTPTITILTALAFSTKPAYARIINPVLPSILGSGYNPGEALAYMIGAIWKSFVIIGSLSFILYFAWGGIRWLTAQGDKSKFEEGRNKIANGLIGLVILAASVAIIQFLGEVLDIQFLQTLLFEFPTPTP